MLERIKVGINRGDTLVEVLFAITIFSLLAVSAMALMNRGVAVSQQSVELTSVRQHIDGQAEILRLLHGAYVGAYQPGATIPAATLAARYDDILKKYTVTAASTFSETRSCTPPVTGRFIVNTATGAIETSVSRIVPSVTSSQIVLNSSGGFSRAEGLWVEAVRSGAAPSGGVGFTDFHVRACWYISGSSAPMTTGTIVRLYDPS